MSRNKLYFFLLTTCLLGFLYLFYSIQFSESSSFGACMIKNVTGFPCPSCGTTRAVRLLWQGNILESLKMNPFGILVFMIMIFAPLWIAFDLIFKKQTFLNWYNKIEFTVRTKWIAIVLILLVLLNWIWNIKKGL